MKRLTTLRRLTVATLMLIIGMTAATAPAQAARPPVELRVASYNVRFGGGEDGVFDLDRTAAAIRELDADVIGLQEVDNHWGERSENLDVAQELADRLGMRVRFAPIYDNDPVTPGGPRAQFGVAVLSQHPIVSFTNHDLTRLSTQSSEPVPELMPGFAEAIVQVHSARVHVYSTHLDYRGDPYVRELQVADTLEVLAQKDPNATQILTGDLNALHEAPELAPLWGPLTNTTPLDPTPSYPAGTPTARIDHIAVTSGVDVVDTHVTDSELASTASDHRPIVADLIVPRVGH